MEALIETIAVSAGLLVFCIILGFIYFLIRRYKTISLIYGKIGENRDALHIISSLPRIYGRVSVHWIIGRYGKLIYH